MHPLIMMERPIQVSWLKPEKVDLFTLKVIVIRVLHMVTQILKSLHRFLVCMIAKDCNGPFHKGASAKWQTLDTDIKAAIADVKEKNGKIVLLSNTIISPTTQSVIAEFKSSCRRK